MWPILSKEMTLVTIEADNSEHLIRHDELVVCFNFFLTCMNSASKSFKEEQKIKSCS